ncbi:MAG: mandelate racemase/muconate lactonizing protein [Proteobacteria bacterium]|nr:mandelate racemase/muconate lactonizing protein [Pseudomonadota bacterium]
MKITDVKLRRLTGTMTYPGELWEERGAKPTDLYPAFRRLNVEDSMRRAFPGVRDDGYRVTQMFLNVETDEGITGVVGPLTGDATAFYLLTQLRSLLIGQDPLRTEYLWDVMYRNAPNGRSGDNMIAISHVDYALWDIRAKWLNQPVLNLLGGAVQDRIPAYASTAGFSLSPEKAAERVTMIREQGYSGTKWFFRRGVGGGLEGERANIELMEALRDAAGPDVKVMIDAWANWGVDYTLRMARLLEPFDPAWIEEPVQYALRESYAYLKRSSPIPIAGGEHDFTRWSVKEMLDADMLDVYQFEPIWAGGLSEMIKINALVTAYDVTFVPHVYVPAASAPVAFTLNAMTTPMLEYHLILGEIYQYFLKTPLKPQAGFFYPPDAIGLGLDIDEAKVESESAVTFG